MFIKLKGWVGWSLNISKLPSGNKKKGMIRKTMELAVAANIIINLI